MKIDDILYNWVLYLNTLPKAGPLPDTTCRSIEHRYIAESGEVYEEEKESKPFVNLEQGEKVEKIICTLPINLKNIIVIMYVKCPQLSKEQIAKKLKMDKYKFDRNLYIAKQMILNKLD